MKSLILLEFQHLKFSKAVSEWISQCPYMHIAGCTRTMLLLTEQDVANLPEEVKQQAIYYNGQQAYARLLEFITGLLSRHRGENQVVSQFKEAWEEFAVRMPDKAAQMDAIYQSLLADNGTIRNHVTAELRPAFYECTAHKLSEAKPGETVMVVAGATKHGLPAQSTCHLIHKLDNRAKRASCIVVTHPEEETLESLYRHFLKEKIAGRIVCDIKKLPFHEATDSAGALHRIDRVFVTLPMGKYRDADERLRTEWNQREAFGGKLVHLGGTEKYQRSSPKEWQGLGLDHYVSPERIIGQQMLDQNRNDEIIQQGRLACQNCAFSRLHGKKPIIRNLTLPSQQYGERSGIGGGDRVIAA
jgi:hypothetical protein